MNLYKILQLILPKSNHVDCHSLISIAQRFTPLSPLHTLQNVDTCLYTEIKKPENLEKENM